MGGGASCVKAVEVPSASRNDPVMPHDPLLVDRARTLRRNMSDAEKELWFRLRRRKITGHRFRRQVPVGDFIVDFACISARLIIEVDGGRHRNRNSRVVDEARTASLEASGHRVLRFWNSRVPSDIDYMTEPLFNTLPLPHHPHPPHTPHRSP